MSWRVEALTALGWALELVDEFPISGAHAAPAGAFALRGRRRISGGKVSVVVGFVR